MTSKKELMKNDTNSINSLWMQYTLDKHEVIDGSIFAFYEGEDRKFYNYQIRQLVGKNILSYECKGKQNVIKIQDKLIKERNDSNTLFFIDKAFDFDKLYSEEIFVTEKYSVENYYTDVYVLENILIDEMGMNSTSLDFKKILNQYIESHQTFYDLIKNVIFFEIACLKNDLLIDFQWYRLERNIQISFSSVTVNKQMSFDEVMEAYEEKLLKSRKNNKKDSETNLTNFNEKKNEIKNYFEKKKEYLTQNFDKLIPGKKDLWFFIKFIETLKTENNKGRFDKKYSSFNVAVYNNILSNLVRYTKPSLKLTDYICFRINN